MISKDDMPEDIELVWVYQTTRFLVPRKIESFAPGVLVNEAYDIDAMSTFQAGRPAACKECGWVGINTTGFPWGEKRHGKSGFYCPHCDGAEDA